MRSVRAYVVIALLGLSTVASAANIPNWPAPKTWTPTSSGRMALTAATYPPLPFIPIPPCRVIDTRTGSGFSGAYGPPSMLGGGAQRSFTITGQCGIPTGAAAVSFNFSVWVPASRGSLFAFPAGDVVPITSNLNWEAGILALGNAGISPLGTGGAITIEVLGPSSVDIIVDVNGFYGQTPADPSLGFEIDNTSFFPTMTVRNFSTSCIMGCGLYSQVAGGTAIAGYTTTGSKSEAGVWGDTSGTALGVHGESGGYVGVLGQTHSSTSDVEGVLGRDSTGAGTHTGYLSAGVRGEGQTGVVGLSNIGGGAGVIGIAYGAGGYGVAGEAASPATTGVEAFGDLVATGAKPFVEPHPTDPTMTIRYVALEGPEAGTYFRGTTKTVNGEAVIAVPESFRIVTAEEGLTVQVTPVGAYARMMVVSRDLNQIVVRSTSDVTFDYHVNGIRRAFKDWQVVSQGIDFRPASPDQTMPSWLTQEAKSRLIANGTYNADGTVNMNTAERLGWAQAWREQAAAAATKAVTHP